MALVNKYLSKNEYISSVYVLSTYPNLNHPNIQNFVSEYFGTFKVTCLNSFTFGYRLFHMWQQTVLRVATDWFACGNTPKFFHAFLNSTVFCFYPQKQKDKGIEVDTRVREKVLFAFFCHQNKNWCQALFKGTFPFLNSFFTFIIFRKYFSLNKLLYEMKEENPQCASVIWTCQICL